MLDLDSNISQSGIIAQISLFVKHYLIIIHLLTKKMTILSFLVLETVNYANSYYYSHFYLLI